MDWEGQLASESSSLGDEARLAFLEEFALAGNATAKRALVQRQFVPGTPDFWFYDALCVVLELQALMEADEDQAAWKLLGENKVALETTEQQLSSSACWRRAQRLQRRRLMLELDLCYKLKRPGTEILGVTQRISTSLQVNYLDPEPVGAVSVRKEALPTTLSHELLDLDKIIDAKLELLKLDAMKVETLKQLLRSLDIFGREKTFQKVCEWDGADDDRWKLLEVFLDEFAFEYTDIPRYLDLIVEDVKRSKDLYHQGWSFSFRTAHNKLSFSQLLECARRSPEHFKSNTQFAVRGVQLLTAAAKVDTSQLSDFKDEARYAKELQQITTYLEFLHDFAGSAVDDIRVPILYRKLELLRLACFVNPKAAKELLECLVEYIRIAGSNTLRYFGSVGEFGFQNVSQQNHERVLEQTLRTIWRSGVDAQTVATAIAGQLDTKFLESQYALTMIKMGQGAISQWTNILLNNGSDLAEQANSSELTFCESSPSYFMPEDPLRIYVRARNVKTVTAHLYEIKTLEYYSRLRREIKGNISLDGLLPTEEQVIDLSHLSAWQEARVPVEFFSKKAQRGAFVVEVFEKGLTCRAILRKGFLRHVERITHSGHEFTILDERGNLLQETRALVLNLKTGGSKAQLGREYCSDHNGVITVPFRHPNEPLQDNFAIAFSVGSFGSFHGSFDYLPESFGMAIDMHIDSEQLLPGRIAQLVTRSRILVAGIATGEPLSLLVDVRLEIEVGLVNSSNVGSSSHKETQTFESMEDILSNPPRFEIPMQGRDIRVTIKARVRRPDPTNAGDLPEVSASKHFAVQRVNDFEQETCTPHFVRRPLVPRDPTSPEEFCLLILGHNGEPVPNVRVGLQLKHVHSTELISASLQADTTGEIKLGKLDAIETLSAAFSGSSAQRWEWELPNLRSYRPQIVNCSAGEAIEIPIPFAFSSHVQSWMKDNLISVCEVVDTVLQSAAQSAQLEVMTNKFQHPIGFRVLISQAGVYLLYIRPLDIKYPITVSEKKNALGLIVQPTQILLATRTVPLIICSQELKVKGGKKVLEVCLRNSSIASTLVVVSFKHFLDSRKRKISEVILGDGLTNASSSRSRLPKLSFPSEPHENDYLKMRKISDEYAYILQRRALVSASEASSLFLGLPSLSKPSLLQNPHVVSESDMEVVTAQAGDAITGFKTTSTADISAGVCGRGGQMPRGYAMRRRKIVDTHPLPSMSFLGEQSIIVSSSVVDPSGVVRVDLDGLDFFSCDKEAFEVCTMVFDLESGYVCTQEVTVSPNHAVTSAIPKQDIRLSTEEALAPSKHFQQADSHECVRAGEERMLPRSFSSAYALYENLDSAIDLWPTLTTGSEVDAVAAKLKEWRRLTMQEKLHFYYVNACDDFNFYISRKDPLFFDLYARPLIVSKVSKSLIDYYVLNDETSLRRFYLAPATFQRLSCIEKLLIAERMTDSGERERICRAVIREIEASYPAKCSSITLANMFNTVISQGQVDPTSATPLEEETVMASGFGLAAPLPESVAYSPTAARAAPPGASANMSFGASFGGAPSIAFSYRSEQCTTSLPSTKKHVLDLTESSNDRDDDFGVRSLDSESFGSDEDEEDDDGDDSEADDQKKKAKKVKQEVHYIPPGKVRKLQEKHYFTEQYPSLVGVNMFWKEFAEHMMRSPGQRFVSSYFPEALTSITEGLFALAVLDLTTDTAPADVQLVTASSIRVKVPSSNDTVLYHRSIVPAQSNPDANSVLILKQETLEQNNDKCLEFVVNKLYVTTVTLSNIGSKRLDDINLLLQVPQGAIPMESRGFYTRNAMTTIEANHTREFSFSFYFPTDGVFEQYPARASIGGEVVAWASPQGDSSFTFKVVRNATCVNLASWNDVSARGSIEEVTRFLESAKPDVNIDYGKVYWRCHDEDFYRGLVTFLRSRMIFVPGIWKYSLLHRDEAGSKEFFGSSDDLAQSIGSGFFSSFADEARLYRNERSGSAFERFDHCEFGPFLTRRVHPMTGKVDAQVSWGQSAPTKAMGKRILNAQAREYFGSLCQRLGMRTHLDGQNLLVLTFYMVLFDRIDKALNIFSQLKTLPPKTKEGVEGTVQYAYLDAFLDFFRSTSDAGLKFSAARRAIAQHIEHPQPRWRQRFSNMKSFVEEFDAFEAHKLNQLEQMEIIDVPTDQRDPSTATSIVRLGNQVKLEANVGAGMVMLTTQCLRQCEVSLYPVDLELMFSAEPFSTSADSAASTSSLLLIEPRNRLIVDVVPSSEDLTNTTVSIPDELVATQMMVRIREIPSSRTVSTVAPPIDLIRPYFNSRLTVEIMTQCGVLQVLHDGLPVRSCYIKVYAKVSSSGGRSRIKTEFYKDGYTDLLGKFDYVGINGDLISSVEKFAILISHEKFGASVEQVDPPVLAATVGDFTKKDEREMSLY